MRIFIVILTAVFLASCGSGTPDIEKGGQRPGAGTSETIPANPQDAAQTADPAPRFYWNGKELRSDEPGVLYSIDNDHSIVNLRDITTGDHMRFTLKEGTAIYNGEVAVENALPIKTDSESNTVWYKGISAKDGQPVYVVVELL